MKADFQSVGKVLRDGYFEIPRYQRTYDWTEREVRHLWNDAIERDEHFLGSLLVFSNPEDEHARKAIVDGQQRLTTLTIALCALRDCAKRHRGRDLATGTHTNYIERQDDLGKRKYVMKTQESYPILQGRVQQETPDTSIKPSSDTEKRIIEAHELFGDLIALSIKERSEEEKWSPTWFKRKAVKHLVELRDRLVGLKVVYVRVESEREAIVIFETLNSRGKNLDLGDLMKALVVGRIPKKTNSVDAALVRWSALRDESVQRKYDFDKFVHHSWISRYGYQSKELVYQDAKKKIGEKDCSLTPETCLSELEEDARVYAQILDQKIELKAQSAEAASAVRALETTFGVSIARSVIMSLLRAVDRGVIAKVKALAMLRILESFHFLHNYLLGKSSSGGTSKRYSKYAHMLQSVEDRGTGHEYLRTFAEEMAKSTAPRGEVVAKLLSLNFDWSDLSDQRKAKYILERLAIVELPAVVLSPKMTVEHLLPRSGKFSQGVIGSLGNLVLLSGPINQQVANKAFSEKRKLLKSAKAPLPDLVANAQRWNAGKVSELSKARAMIGYDEVWGPPKWTL